MGAALPTSCNAPRERLSITVDRRAKALRNVVSSATLSGRNPSQSCRGPPGAVRKLCQDDARAGPVGQALRARVPYHNVTQRNAAQGSATQPLLPIQPGLESFAHLHAAPVK